MQKTTIPLAALDRILVRVRGLIADLKRQPNEGETKMVEWLENMIRDNADDDPVATIIRKIGKLRQGWDRPLTSMEQHSLYGSLDCLREITDPEWEMMGRFLAYTPRMGERLYQVRNRDRFIQDPMNTLGCAEDWWKQHKPARRPAQQPRQEPQRGEFSMAEFREMFGNLKGETAEPAQPPTPIPPPPQCGQTSLSD